MVETFPIKTTMEMLNLSQEQGNNFFLKKHTRPIILEILNKRLEHIVEDYVQREQNSKNSKEKGYLNKTKEEFITMLETLKIIWINSILSQKTSLNIWQNYLVLVTQRKTN
jgi:hypothetical protein